MRFNLLLDDAGIKPDDVSIILHNTTLKPLRDRLLSLAMERPDLFEAYQSVHSTQAEATLRGRPYFVTFVPFGDHSMMFVGGWRITSVDNLPTKEIYADPRFTELEQDFGATDTAPAKNIARAPEQLRFLMEPIEALNSLRGRLTISTPPGRAYVRIAGNLDPVVLALSAAPVHSLPPPAWRNLVLTGLEVRALPSDWATRLREWRGIYLIVDETDGERYVGSAYGADNLLGRWRSHVTRDLGITAQLGKRDPANFRFSILERVSPDMPADKVIQLERTWMDRLHTVEYGLNS